MEEKKLKEKMSSRKFVVWITWLVIFALSVALDIIVLIITKNFPESLIELTTLVVSSFFKISALYLGVNFGQKAVYAIKDKKENNTKEEEELK